MNMIMKFITKNYYNLMDLITPESTQLENEQTEVGTSTKPC